MGKVKESMHTAPCMFCGQMVQFMADDLLPETEAQELAAMHCSCAEALEYKKEKNRKENALKNVSKLFGEDAEAGKRVSNSIVEILEAAVEEIYTGGLAKVTLNLRGGFYASTKEIGRAHV